MQSLAPTWNLEETATTRWYVRLFPSLNDLAFLLPIFVLFAKMNGTQLLFSDGDTGWHIRTGEWILNHHAVPTVDLFSFSKAGQPWFAWEWAWDVIFASIHSLAGLGGIAFVTTLILGIFTLLLYRLALRVSHNHLMSIAVTALAAGVSSIHWLARPHLVSWICTLLFLHAIEQAHSGQRRFLYLLPVLMIFWVNLHGGFVAGLLILGCYSVGESLSALLESSLASGDRSLDWASLWRCSSAYWITFALCFAATFVNPYGWQLHRHIYAYLTDSELLDKIQEFQSISFHAGPALLFEVMLMLAAFVVLVKLRNLQFAPVLLICLWAHYALLSARHIPLFMMVAAPFVADLLATGIVELRKLPWLGTVGDALRDISEDFQTLEAKPRLHLLSAASLLLIVGLFAEGKAPFAPQFNTESFPIQAIPVLEQHTGSRIFTTDQWADYLLYRMYPAQRVFFDGRSDFYGNDFVKVNQRISSAEHDWKSLLKKFAINLVIVQPETPLAAVLKLSPGSKVLFDDGRVIVFDISGIYRSSLGSSNTADRAASASFFLQPAMPPVADIIHHSTPSWKGNHRDLINATQVLEGRGRSRPC